jgi:hypothetical protein
MTCKGCQSNKQGVFSSEIGIYFPEPEGLDKSLVFVFPKLTVCFHCGLTEFTIPERELQVLEHGSPVNGAAVLAQKVVRPSETRIKSPSPGTDG